ncbi:PREDICTED: E3 ubiquitin-protein ligase NEURL3 isoform X2 [Gavialis gangeticus]|uniref:E3 ubiquitin-protein ligase NEURL3 isoform X2 n=1 Tax=Gavialis gangeticus TaxID=94835 RepID=UPI00092F2921|nr:PREDICTED: E3 ubiquitin-protein ligase NEURL3 isoform X2 [Gavialis gangeticus]
MGSCESSLNGLDKPLHFHPTTKGFQIQLDAACRTASRTGTFCDGIVFSNRPVQLDEKVVLQVLYTHSRWDGGLRVGFTSLNPSQMIPKDLPHFVCPSLVLQGQTWASLLPTACVGQGTIVRFWVNRRGQVFFSINNKPRSLLFKGVPVEGPLWAVMDIYGQTKAVQLLDQYGVLQELPPELPCSFPLDEPARKDPYHLSMSSMEKCTICYARVADTLLYPCGHTDCCYGCVQRMLATDARCPICRQNIKDVVRISLRRTALQPQSSEGFESTWEMPEEAMLGADGHGDAVTSYQL